MLKFIAKIFHTREDAHQTTLEVVVEPTPQEAFDDAVKEVVKRTQREAIEEQLARMCYSPEQLRDTDAAMKENGNFMLNEEELSKLKKKYPLVCYEYSGYRDNFQRIGLKFSLQSFVDKLLDAE
jgi:hypothetical protein